MSVSLSQSLRNLSSRILERIELGRCSATRYASADMFIGPCIGRKVSPDHLESLTEDIGSPEQFHSWEPLLAVHHTGDEAMLKGKLVVIGGGHRLGVSILTIHTLILPYKLVSFTGLGPNGDDLDIFEYGGLITFNVEATEPRPQQYSFMQQVVLYGHLKVQWQDMERARVSKLKGRKRNPRYMSHKTLYEFYEQQSDICGSQARWAIAFLGGKGIKQSTRRNYMSGADRLLDAGVVPYLCHLENTANASFNRGSLNAVRNWSVEKVRDVVELWRVRTEAGLKVHYTFSDRIGREVDGKGRGRKRGSQACSQGVHQGENGRNEDNRSSAKEDAEHSVEYNTSGGSPGIATGHLQPLDRTTSSPPGPSSENARIAGSNEVEERATGRTADERPRCPDVLPPVMDRTGTETRSDSGGGDEYTSIDNIIMGLLERKQKLNEQNIMDIDLETCVNVAKRVKDKLGENNTAAESVISEMIDDMASLVRAEEKKDIRLIGNGGILDSKLTLCQSDTSPIEEFSLANDRAMTFTFSFLTRWTEEGLPAWVFVDSLVSAGWWDTALKGPSKRLESLKKNARILGMLSEERRDELWKSDVCLMPICGAGHWSLIVIVGLRCVYHYFESVRKEKHEVRDLDCKGRIFFVDSLGKGSAHVGVSGNLYHFLRVTYPQRHMPTVANLRSLFESNSYLFSLQEGLECGFYVTYHMGLLSRVMKDLVNASPAQVEVLLREGHATYTFQQFRSDVDTRLRAMLEKFSNTGKEIQVGCWVWGKSCAWGVLDNVDDVSGAPCESGNIDVSTEKVMSVSGKRKGTSVCEEPPEKKQCVWDEGKDRGCAAECHVAPKSSGNTSQAMASKEGSGSGAAVHCVKVESPMIAQHLNNIAPSADITSLVEEMLTTVFLSRTNVSVGNNTTLKQEAVLGIGDGPTAWHGDAVVKSQTDETKGDRNEGKEVKETRSSANANNGKPPAENEGPITGSVLKLEGRDARKAQDEKRDIKYNQSEENRRISLSQQEFMSMVVEAEAFADQVCAGEVVEEWRTYKGALIDLLRRLKEAGKEQG